MIISEESWGGDLIRQETTLTFSRIFCCHVVGYEQTERQRQRQRQHQRQWLMQVNGDAWKSTPLPLHSKVSTQASTQASNFKDAAAAAARSVHTLIRLLSRKKVKVLAVEPLFQWWESMRRRIQNYPGASIAKWRHQLFDEMFQKTAWAWSKLGLEDPPVLWTAQM